MLFFITPPYSAKKKDEKFWKGHDARKKRGNEEQIVKIGTYIIVLLRSELSKGILLLYFTIMK
jgi:hypothetical protein